MVGIKCDGASSHQAPNRAREGPNASSDCFETGLHTGGLQHHHQLVRAAGAGAARGSPARMLAVPVGGKADAEERPKHRWFANGKADAHADADAWKTKRRSAGALMQKGTPCEALSDFQPEEFQATKEAVQGCEIEMPFDAAWHAVSRQLDIPLVQMKAGDRVVASERAVANCGWPLTGPSSMTSVCQRG